MKVTTGKPVAPQPTFELQLPDEFVQEPKWKVFLPHNHSAYIHEATWHIESEDKSSEREVNGFRVELIGPDGAMRSEHKFRYRHEVVRNLIKVTEQFLRENGDDDDEDEVTFNPSAPKRRA